MYYVTKLILQSQVQSASHWIENIHKINHEQVISL